MRISKKAHTLAVLRLAIDPKKTQKEFADLLHCSVDTIQSLETGRLKLSDEFARRISHETGVSLKWLLDDVVSAPIVSAKNEPYTCATFASRKAKLKRPQANIFDAIDFETQLVGFLNLIASMRFGAYEENRTELFDYKMDRALVELNKEFPESQAFIKSYRTNRINLEASTRQIKKFIQKALLTKWIKHPEILRKNLEHWGENELMAAFRGISP